MSTLRHPGLSLGFSREGESFGRLTAVSLSRGLPKEAALLHPALKGGGSAVSSAERLGTAEGVNGENLDEQKVSVANY